MNLEQIYWIAGIVVAAVMVIQLLRSEMIKNLMNSQTAKIKGNDNTVQQSVDDSHSDRQEAHVEGQRNNVTQTTHEASIKGNKG